MFVDGLCQSLIDKPKILENTAIFTGGFWCAIGSIHYKYTYALAVKPAANGFEFLIT